MLGDNPGVYANVPQTEWWPFVPAIGVVIGVCLVVAFITATVMALKRESPVSWAATCGLIATVVLGFSIFGCAVAASQYEARDRQHHDVYVAQVAEWVSDEVGGSLAASDAARLLNGESLTVQVDGKSDVLTIEQDRSHDVLKLMVNGCDSPTRPGCGETSTE